MAKRQKGCLGCIGSLFQWIWLGYFSIMIIGSIFAGIFSLFSNSGDNTKLADGFDISAYNVVLDVNEDNTIDVTENLTVNFRYSNKHGIYKFTPQWLEYTGKDGETIKRKSTISDYRAIGDEYTIDTVKKKKRIKIGSADEYVGLGEKTYVIKYTYDMGKDPYKGFDELIFHAYGDYWGTEIKNASIEVNMPKNINNAKVNFFLDKYRETNANEFVDYNINGNSIYASFNQEKYYEYQEKEYCSLEYNIDENGNCEMPSYYGNEVLDSSLTIDIELPEGYFVGGSWNYGWGSFILCLIIFGITIWNFIRWKKYGKDFPKRVETVEFYPPENYSSAEIGYIYGKQTNKKLTISLIVELASKGYIKIDEIEKKKKKEIQITNMLIKPKEQLKFDDLVPNRVIKVKKLQLADPTILNKSELTMMTYLFKKGDEKELKTNIEKFLEVRDSLVQKGFIKIVSDNEDTRFDELTKRKEEYELSKKQYEEGNVKYYDTLSKMPTLTHLELEVYNRLFEKEDVIILSEHKTFYKAFNDVETNLKSKLKDLIDDKNATKKMVQSIFISIATLIIYLISYCLVEDMDPNWKIIYYLSFACIFVNIYFTIIMKRKTEYGEEIIAKVKGFRNFLITVEKEKLEALVLENPNYFYNILPYTYVLNISKKWIEKFEDIQIPEVDMGNYDFNDFNSFSHLYNDVYYPEPVRSSSSSRSSGCSSCGGGCSSCGGGCSSCGGGGSW